MKCYFFVILLIGLSKSIDAMEYANNKWGKPTYSPGKSSPLLHSKRMREKKLRAANIELSERLVKQSQIIKMLALKLGALQLLHSRRIEELEDSKFCVDGLKDIASEYLQEIKRLNSEKRLLPYGVGLAAGIIGTLMVKK